MSLRTVSDYVPPLRKIMAISVPTISMPQLGNTKSFVLELQATGTKKFEAPMERMLALLSGARHNAPDFWNFLVPRKVQTISSVYAVF